MRASANSVAVAGGRDYVLTADDFQFLERTLARLQAREIATDGTLGVAAQVEAWARSRGIGVQRFVADFVCHGLAPVTRRNAMLVNFSAAVIVFPGDEGTDDLVLKARRRKLPVAESPSRQRARVRPGVSDVRLRPGPRLSP